MTFHYAPQAHVGHYAFPEGYTHARVYNCPALESVSFPEGCTHARVEDCPALESVSFPEGCIDAWVEDCPALTGINGKPVNTADQARPYLEAIAAVALEPGKLDMGIVRKEDAHCGTVACIAGWASVLFPDDVRPDFALIDAIPLLGNEAASKFFNSTYEGRAFLERFLPAQPTEITTA